MFNNILICSFVSENNIHSLETTFELAKKFNSNVILLKCIHKELPTFALFHTKSEKKKQKELDEKIQIAFKEVKNIADAHNVLVNTDTAFVESLSEYITTYVHKNNIDLFVVDSTLPLDISIDDHKDVINRIYKNIECPILTLK